MILYFYFNKQKPGRRGGARGYTPPAHMAAFADNDDDDDDEEEEEEEEEIPRPSPKRTNSLFLPIGRY
jgi:hypothetical protein